MTSLGKAAVKIDNERTRVTQWNLAPGATTGYHRHEYDYLVLPMGAGELELTGPDGQKQLRPLDAGEPYFSKEGVEHNTKNIGAEEFIFIEIEFK